MDNNLEFEKRIEQARMWATIGKINQAAMWLAEAEEYGTVTQALVDELQALANEFTGQDVEASAI